MKELLGRLGRYLYLEKKAPSNETSLQREVFPLLKVVFPSTTTEWAIPHVVKTYKADFAIAELAALLEFKFCRTKADWRRALDEVYADMKGYAVNPQWRNFFVVFYLAEQFGSSEEISAEFQMTSSRAWTPVVIFATGQQEEPAS